MIEIELDLLGVILGTNHELAVRAWSNEDSGMETDRRRHDKAIVVIGVFPNQIDSSRCLVNAWRFAKELDEFLLQGMGVIFDR